MSIIPPISIPNGLLQYRPVSDVVPFTYRSGMTYQALLESMRVYVSETLTTYFVTEFGAITDSWRSDLDAIVALVNTQLTETLSEILAGTNVPLNDATIRQVLETANSVSVAYLDTRYGPGGRIAPVPNGTDDTAALNAWLTAIAGKSGVIPAGTYQTTDTLTIPANTKVTGYGAHIKAIHGTAANTGNDVGGTFDTVVMKSNTHLEGVEIEQVRGANGVIGGNGIYIANSTTDIEVVNCWIHDFNYKGVRIDGSSQFLVTGCRITNGYNEGVYVFASSWGRISDNYFEGVSAGVMWWGGDSGLAADYQNAQQYGAAVKWLTISGNTVKGTAQTGAGIWGSLGQYITVADNVIDTVYDLAIDLEGTFDSTVTGNIVTNAKNGCFSAINGSQRCVFSGNQGTNSLLGGAGFRFDWGQVATGQAHNVSWASTDIRVTGNVFRCGLTPISMAPGCATLCTISDNYIESFHPSDSQGLIVLIRADEFTISNNTLRQAAGPMAIKLFASSNCIVDGNKILTGSDSSAQGDYSAGVIIQWDTNKSAQYNRIVNNVIRGFVKGIYDQVHNDAGYNTITGNQVSVIAKNGTSGNLGVIDNNKDVLQPQNASQTIVLAS